MGLIDENTFTDRMIVLIQRLDADIEEALRCRNELAQMSVMEKYVSKKVLVAIDERLGMTVAVKSVIDTKPEKWWKPPELKDIILEMRDNGKVYSRSKSLEFGVYSALKNLLRDGFIEKRNENEIPQRTEYRLKREKNE